MEMRYFIVIGKEKDTGDNPLAETLCQIGNAMRKKNIRVFVTSSTGTCEFGSKAEKKLTKDVVTESFASVNESNYRMLLLDAESISGRLNPVSGLLVWHQYFRTKAKTSYIGFKGIITDFFDGNNNGLWWTGFVEPKEYNVVALAKPRWEIVMKSLQHDSWRQGGTR